MRSGRGFLALLLVLALVIGTGQPMLAAAEMQSGAPASGMIMDAMSSAVPMSGMCDKCITKDQATHACFAVCVDVQAVLPVTSILRVCARAPLAPLVVRRFNGSAAPPDLPPPKLNGLV